MLEQVPPLHAVLQAPEPLHVYVPQPFSGSVPAARLVQVPRLPAMLQARHAPVHELEQQ